MPENALLTQGIESYEKLVFMSKSLADLEQILTVEPHNTTAWYERGDILANLGRYTEAFDSFDRVVQLEPDHHRAWVFRGVTLIYLERYEDALASCDRALEIASTHREAWMFRGVALHRLGRYREAYVSYDQAIPEDRTSLWTKLTQWLRQAWNALA